MDENEVKDYTKVPAKLSPWSSFKNFWLKPIVLELTPYQEKVFKEVHDFWNQEVYYDKGFHLRPRQEFAGINDEEPEVNISL